MFIRHSNQLWLLTVATLIGCGGATSSSDGTYVDVGVTDTNDETPVVAAGDLPCDVIKVLDRCRSCHGPVLEASASGHLLSRADFTRKSDVDPTKTVGERALIRMADSAASMPPPPASAATAAEIATLKAWVDGGMVAGTSCDPAPDPFAVAPKCTSGTTYSRGTRGGSAMYPGRTCINCHSTDAEAPTFVLAGTVFPSAHEPDNCVPALGGKTATIEVIDANKKKYKLTANSSGNFYLEDRLGTFKSPYSAKVVYDGRERIMAGAQTDGDCNSCHTQSGDKKAPGRILLP